MKHIKKLGLGFLLLLAITALFSLTSEIVNPKKASAQSWVSRSTISYQGINYVDSNTGDSIHHYQRQGGAECPTSRIETERALASSGELVVITASRGGGCGTISSRTPIDISNTDLSESGEEEAPEEEVLGNATYVTRNVITYDGKTYYDSNISDGTMQYVRLGTAASDCERITVIAGTDRSEAIFYDGANNAGRPPTCASAGRLTVTGYSASGPVFFYINSDTIRGPDNQVYRLGEARTYSESSDCPDRQTIVVRESDNGRGQLFNHTSSGGGPREQSDCQRNSGGENIEIGLTNRASLEPGYSNEDGDEGGAEEDNSCESTSGPLGWVMCPIAGLLDSATGWLDEQIVGLMRIDEDVIGSNNDESREALRLAWSRLRDIAFAILIPIMLVMVIGTALNMEVFSAYTVKKALPRMVIAVIFIALSWEICMFLINLTNVVGAGIRGLVIWPFYTLVPDGESFPSSLKAALDIANISSQGDQGILQGLGETAGTAALGFTAVAAGFATGMLSLTIIVSTLTTAALTLGVVFLVLVARQMFVVAFMLLAPLAILAWIFPGNDKPWKLWWLSFSKLLIMYPFVMLLIGVGQAFALVIATSRVGENRLLTSIMIIAAIIIPYAAIPFTFKWAGGVFGNLAGMVNDKNKGLFDRLKKGRSESRARGWQSFKGGTGNGWMQRNALSRRIGTGIGAGAGGGKGVFGTGFTAAQRRRGTARMDQHMRHTGVNDVMKSDAWNGVNQDDTALHAGVLLQDYKDGQAAEILARDMGAKDLADRETALGRALTKAEEDDVLEKHRAEAQRGVAAWQASGLSGRAAAFAAAQQLVSTGTGYRDLEHMTKTLGRAAGGNANTGSAMAGFANSETKKVGRGDLAPSFGTLQGLVHGEMAGGESPEMADYAAAIVKTTRGQDPVTLLRGKTKELENMAPALSSHLEQQILKFNASGGTDAAVEEEILRTISQIDQFDQSKSYASDDNQQVVNNLVASTSDMRSGFLNPERQAKLDAMNPRRGLPPDDPRIKREP